MWGLVDLGKAKKIDPSEIDPSPDSPAKYGQKVIGRGAQSRVYLGKFDHDTRAVKVFPLGFSTARQYINFRTEFRSMQAFNDPNIVPVYGVVDNPHFPAMVMYYCSRGALDKLISKMDLDQRLWAIRCVARGLSVLHVHMVAHRDLKPANIFVDGSGKALIGDFGMAKFLAESSGQTKSVMVGTVDYMAPEVARGECGGIAWLQADMWSFGIICFQVLTGNLPFQQRDNALQVHLATMKKVDLPPLAKDLPENVVKLVVQCLQLNPRDRPSAKQAIKTLEFVKEAPILPR